MSPLTIFLGRFFGLSCLLMCAVLVTRPKASLEAINALTANPGLILVTDIFTMAAGAAMVVGHNVWSGRVLPGGGDAARWLTLIKGVVLMAATPRALSAIYRALHYPERFRLIMAAGLAFSVWLTVTAFLVLKDMTPQHSMTAAYHRPSSCASAQRLSCAHRFTWRTRGEGRGFVEAGMAAVVSGLLLYAVAAVVTGSWTVGDPLRGGSRGGTGRGLSGAALVLAM